MDAPGTTMGRSKVSRLLVFTTEMMGLMSATRAYESNVAAMNAARTMALKALEIGGTT